MLTWKKGSKSISFRQNPVNFNDRSSARTVFETTDFLKVVKLNYDSTTYTNKVFICDEMKFIKAGDFKTDNNGKYQMYINNEYYVNDEFTGDSPNFLLSNRMLYTKFKAYLCQERGKEKLDLALV